MDYHVSVGSSIIIICLTIIDLILLLKGFNFIVCFIYVVSFFISMILM